MQETTRQAGMVDAANRVARELLRTPRFKEGLKMVLDSLDPESAPELVRTLVWEDTDVFLSLAGSLPRLLNIFFYALKELAEQLGSFPPEMLSGFLAGAVEGLEGEALGEALGSAARLLARVSEASGERVPRSAGELARSAGRGFAGARHPGGQAEEPSPAAAALAAVSRAVKAAAAAAAVEGSPARRALKACAEDLAGAVREHPELVREAAPVLEALRAAGWGVA